MSDIPIRRTSGQTVGQGAEKGGADPGAVQGFLAHKSVGRQRYLDRGKNKS